MKLDNLDSRIPAFVESLSNYVIVTLIKTFISLSIVSYTVRNASFICK